MLVTRFITASILLPVFIGSLLWLPNQYWSAFLLLPLFAASWEWAGLAGYQRRGRWLFSGITLLSALLVVFLASRIDSVATVAYLLAALFWLGLAPLWLIRKWRPAEPWVMGAAGWIILVSTWLALVRLQEQPLQLLILLGIVWIADSTAYLAGKKLGRHKLAPDISPGKTWEGVMGACVGVSVYYVVLLTGYAPAAWLDERISVVLFGVITIASIEGDLFESWIKRQAGVKDSGRLLPGHGGVLDRIDGLTASMPLAALILLYAG